ncbi:MAG: recombination mediator RecR [Planctomycetota bacterium]
MSVLATLVERLMDLPGIGPKSAERIAHYLVRRPPEESRALAEALVRAAENLRPCSVCSHVAETDPCPICADPARDASLLCVVETSRDLEALESSGEFRGRYHVLGGHVSPAEGVGLEDLNVATLLDRVPEGVREVVLATNPTFEGEATSAMLSRELKARGVRVTRIARGIPSGGEIVHMNGAVLAEALRGRSEFA